MHHPLVGERVWVSGCRDEFIVAAADYDSCLAAILPSRDMGTARRSLPFALLFPHHDFIAAQENAINPPAHDSVLRSSLLCIHHTRLLIRDARDTIRITVDIVRKTQELIAESDLLIARSKTIQGFGIPAIGTTTDTAPTAAEPAIAR